MPGQLVVIAGPDRGRSFPLAEGTSSQVGRGATSQVKLLDLSVSRVHCEVRVEGQRVTIHDARSAGGTFVNGERVTSRELRPGDAIKIGNSELLFAAEAAAPAARARTAAVAVTQAESAPAGREAVQEPPAILLANRPGAPKLPQALKDLQGLAGADLGSYHLRRVVGVGQIGVVFEAIDRKDGKTVALKVLRSDFAKDGKAMRRFIRGMKAARALNHPNLIELYNAGIAGPHCWISMEFIDGENLHQILQQIAGVGQRDWRPTRAVAIDVAKALQCVHEHGVVHRAVTPSNIMVRRRDLTAKLGDALLAKHREGAEAEEVTRTGEFVGNVYFMAPERTQRGSAADARADLYSLGVTLYYFLTGRLPFGGRSMIEVITQIRETPPESLRVGMPGLPVALEKVLLRLLAKRPEDRYPTAAALLADLEAVR